MQTLEYPYIIKNVHAKKLYEKIITFFHIAFYNFFIQVFFLIHMQVLPQHQLRHYDQMTF